MANVVWGGKGWRCENDCGESGFGGGEAGDARRIVTNVCWGGVIADMREGQLPCSCGDVPSTFRWGISGRERPDQDRMQCLFGGRGTVPPIVL